MTQNLFANPKDLTICFAHVAYQMAPTFEKRQTHIPYFQSWSREDLSKRIPEADVLVVSGFWDNSLLKNGKRLKFIQSIGAGYDQFPLEELRAQGIRLASAQGVNRNAVSEHAMAHVLSFARQMHTGRDNQKQHQWRPMISDLNQREDELGGQTMLIIGLGGIGSRLAKLAKAFDMQVIATKRNLNKVDAVVDSVHTPDKLGELLPQADYVVLTCPLTRETETLINAAALSKMKDSAYLINMARGRCVDEPALLEAIQNGTIAGAGIDHFWDEPLPTSSPFWGLENMIITPHTGGETRMYEENVIDILLENIGRLSHGETKLFNQIV